MPEDTLHTRRGKHGRSGQSSAEPSSAEFIVLNTQDHVGNCEHQHTGTTCGR